MGRGGRKLHWREVLPDPGCKCFGHKSQASDPQWHIIAEADDQDDAERRGGISYEKQENHAQYVRMLGDIKGKTRQEMLGECHSTSHSHHRYSRRRSSLLKDDMDILKRISDKRDPPEYIPTTKRIKVSDKRSDRSKDSTQVSTVMRRKLSSHTGPDSGNRKNTQQVSTAMYGLHGHTKNAESNLRRNSLRFSSLHRTRRKTRPIFKMIHDDTTLLDPQYVGVAWCLLSTVGDWDFNIFNLDKLTSGRALFHVGLHLFQEHNLIEIFHLDIVKLMRCITLIEEGYHSANPYHNAVHAADVAQAMHCYLKENKVTQYMTPLEKMTAILSAMAHDLDHPGVNQAFLIATSNHLAALYDNTSVLEQHHWRTAMGVFRESGVFDHFTAETWQTIEFQMKSLILATDITRQAEFLNKLKYLLDKSELDMTTTDHKHFMLQIALKCADICNPCRVSDISRKWSKLVCEEFFKQGDYERKLHLPVTPLCDRQGTTVAKIQTGFMQFVVLPLFDEWYRFNPTSLSETMLANIKSNKSSWDEEIRQQEAQKAKEEQEKNTIPEENEDLNSSTSSTGSKSDGEKDNSDEDDNQIGKNSDKVKCNDSASTAVKQPQIPLPVSSGSPAKQVDSEKENSDPGQEDHIDEDATSNFSEDGDVQDMEMPAFFLRRHSLPVSSPFNTANNLHNKETSNYNPQSFYPNDKKGSFPVGFHSSVRRHSLPTARIMPITSFEKLSEKLSTVKETSPTDGRMAFDFIRWGNRIPRISLSSNVLMNVNLEATRLTDAHGLNQAMLSHQRRYQSEPQVTKPSKSNSVTKVNSSASANLISSSLNKLQNSGRVTTASRGNASKTVENNIHNTSSTKTANLSNTHTFHSKTVLPTTNSNGPRRHSLNSPQRNVPLVSSVLASSLVSNITALPRRASMDDKPRYGSKDIESQPLLHNSGDTTYIEDQDFTSHQSTLSNKKRTTADCNRQQDNTSPFYYNDTAVLLNADCFSSSNTQDKTLSPSTTSNS